MRAPPLLARVASASRRRLTTRPSRPAGRASTGSSAAHNRSSHGNASHNGSCSGSGCRPYGRGVETCACCSRREPPLRRFRAFWQTLYSMREGLQRLGRLERRLLHAALVQAGANKAPLVSDGQRVCATRAGGGALHALRECNSSMRATSLSNSGDRPTRWASRAQTLIGAKAARRCQTLVRSRGMKPALSPQCRHP